MTRFETMIREALREDSEAPPPEEGLTGDVVGYFLRRTRLARTFAWMKMFGTMTFALVSAVAFFLVEGVQAQLACAVGCLIGFIGFGIWWLWYWMVLNRNATLRELKRIELQVAELRAAASR